MEIFGIDVSQWQGNFNFRQAMNEGVKFAILRGMYGNSMKDSKFESYYATCKSLGLPVGAYHYILAANAAQAVEEAQIFINTCLKGKTFEYPIAVDIEDAIQKALPRATNDAIVKAYCDTLQKAGYYATVYCSESFYNSNMNGASLREDYDFWIAKWCSYSNISRIGGMTQFGGETNFVRTTQVAGQTVDQNYAFIDYPAIIKEHGLNGFGKGTSVPTPPPSKPAPQPTPAPAKRTKNADGTYTVKAGDTLGEIASDFGCNYQDLAKWSGISNPNIISVGQIIRFSAPSAPAPKPQSNTVTYTVQYGDTLGEIASKYGTTISALCSLNGISNANLIYAGQVLKINGSAPAAPSAVYYTVQYGDYLGAIAAKYGTTVSALCSMNGIANANLIYPGQRLRVR